MKIHENPDIQKLVDSTAADRSREKTAGGFDEALKKAMAPDTEPATAGVAGSALPAGGVNPLSLSIIETQGAEQTVVARSEALLDLMDAYREKIADPQFSLKQIYPLIQQLENGRDQLAPLLDSLPEGDLKQVVNEVLVTAATEIFKFNKGDYQNG